MNEKINCSSEWSEINKMAEKMGRKQTTNTVSLEKTIELVKVVIEN